LFVEYGVDVVLSGHDHVYERIKPQKGIHYFVLGNSGDVRKDDIRPTGLTARGFDQGHSFMMMEVAGDELFFDVVSAEGVSVDSGVIRRSD
jgi:hypothetical protein